MRVLPGRPDYDCGNTTEKKPAPHRRRSNEWHAGQYMPLWGLPSHPYRHFISQQKKVIQRKANSTVVWYDTEFKQALTRRDSVRSEDLSNAVITLTDGTELRLEENSMVILDTKEKGIEIKLVSGAVRTNRKNAKANTDIKVLVDNKNIDFLWITF